MNSTGFDRTPDLDTCQQIISRFRLKSSHDSLEWQLIFLFERMVAAFALLFLLPFLLVVAIIIVYLSGKAPLIAHRRVGRHNKCIWVYKFRTMWDQQSSERIWSLVERIVVEHIGKRDRIKTGNDIRICSNFARFCRKYSVDELPQLVSVASGELSLIGPRPLVSKELDAFYGDKRDLLVSVKPGLSGIWAINGRSRLSWPERVRMDIEWVEKRTPALYFQILLKTIPAVCTGKDAW